ncbi:hypothetical protein ACFL31_01775 [Candidatus Margulisiibacteriota bacterium]
MMNTKSIVVRLVSPSDKPALPKRKKLARVSNENPLLTRSLNILTGSGIGLMTGIAIYFMLKLIGINFGGLESSLIIGFPSALGIITSLVIF